ncbi:type II toxin-antitoxin system RelE/ParE family toxin [Pseudomonas sp. MYb185]|uniref:type II toxin-antitoxin system RelE/ParE family toxin n=1 Tax=Pseudomonas sp. MYb185 TaxID=1848729 RepID=UPI000CFD8ADE|nr:type II toxin-antitoxin system RelE/ParE family toxin [Pseudomonas sp. MYb185]PRB80507.1 addiction module antitoxin RelB [Pseudomonas sp. MYb185]
MAYIIQKTEIFDRWLSRLKDAKGKVAILRRISRAKGGNLGDIKPVGGDVTEMRLDVGPGYRLYFTRRGEAIILLLCGGDKPSQSRDIKLAKKLVGELE